MGKKEKIMMKGAHGIHSRVSDGTIQPQADKPKEVVEDFATNFDNVTGFRGRKRQSISRPYSRGFRPPR